MQLNPNIILLHNKDYMIHDKGTSKYYKIDKLVFDFLCNVKDGNEVQKDGQYDELVTFLYSNGILYEDQDAGKRNSNDVPVKPKKNFQLTQIDLIGIDLNNFLDKHNNITKFFCSEYLAVIYRISLTLSLIVTILCIGFLIMNWHEFVHVLSESMSLKQGVIAYFSLFIITIFHEFGHIMQCKKYAGYVGRCGIMLYFLFPVLYTDITITNSLIKKEKSIVIMAGVKNQLLVNGVLGIIVILQNLFQGQWNDILIILFLLNTIMILSNLNPFFKYDGYWLLCTKIGVERLYSKAIGCVFNFRQYSDNSKDEKRLFVYGVSLILFYILSWGITISYIYFLLIERIGSFYTMSIILVLSLLILYEIFNRYKENK